MLFITLHGRLSFQKGGWIERVGFYDAIYIKKADICNRIHDYDLWIFRTEYPP